MCFPPAELGRVGGGREKKQHYLDREASIHHFVMGLALVQRCDALCALAVGLSCRVITLKSPGPASWRYTGHLVKRSQTADVQREHFGSRQSIRRSVRTEGLIAFLPLLPVIENVLPPAVMIIFYM